MIQRRTLLGASAAVLAAGRARAQAPGIKLGVLNDMSGPYHDTSGTLSVACVRQAVQDFGDHGFPIEVVVADHGNKPDTGASIARRWVDAEGVDAIIDVPTSSVALAVNTGDAREEQGVPERGRRHHGPDRASSARPTPCTGPTTSTCWPSRPAGRW